MSCDIWCQLIAMLRAEKSCQLEISATSQVMSGSLAGIKSPHQPPTKLRPSFVLQVKRKHWNGYREDGSFTFQNWKTKVEEKEGSSQDPLCQSHFDEV